MKQMDIPLDYKFVSEDYEEVGSEDIDSSPITLDEAFTLDGRINSVEDLVAITSKMNESAKHNTERRENSVIIAGYKFKRDDVEAWLISQDLENDEEDGRNSPDASLEDLLGVYNVTRYVSVGDLLNTLSQAGIELTAMENEAAKLDILWNLGLNTKDYKVQELIDTHRAADGKPVTCLRYLSEERTDKEWLQSGHASMEAKLAASGDASLEKEIRMLGRR